jgi:hypothetical protein
LWRDDQQRAEIVDDDQCDQETFSAPGMREPRTASAPSAKAMSVAIEKPQSWRRRH